jgi:hypothetical protein
LQFNQMREMSEELCPLSWYLNATDEKAKLRALNAELLSALKELFDDAHTNYCLAQTLFDQVQTIIAKAEAE